MKIEQSAPPRSMSTPPIPTRGISRTPLTLAFLTILLSAGMAVAANQLGLLVLLVVPALLLLAGGVTKPDLVLAIFFFIIFTQLSEVAIQSYGLPSLAQPLAGLLVLIILLRIFLYGDRPVKWATSVFIILLYLLTLFVSMIAAQDYTTAQGWFIGFAKDIMGGVIVVFLIQRPASLRNVIWAIIIAGIVMGTISVIQFTTGAYGNSFGGFGGWEQQVSGEISRNRLTGPYANPNAYAQVLVVIVAISLSRLWHEKNTALRLLAGWSSLVCIATIVLTYSRGGLLTLIVTLGVLFLQNRSRLFPILLTIVIGGFLFQFIPSNYLGRLSTLTQISGLQNSPISDQSFRGRLSENIAAWRMFGDHPYLGVGPGHFKLEYQDYSRQIGLDPRRAQRTPASLYLELLAEQGIIGMFVFGLLIYFVLKGLIQARTQFAQTGLHDNADIAVSLFAALVGYLVAATVKNSAYSNVFWLLIGIAISTEQVAYKVLHRSKESLSV